MRIQKKVVIDIYELQDELQARGFKFEKELVDILFPFYTGQVDVFLPLVVDTQELKAIVNECTDIFLSEEELYHARIFYTIGAILEARGVDTQDYILIEIY